MSTEIVRHHLRPYKNNQSFEFIQIDEAKIIDSSLVFPLSIAKVVGVTVDDEVNYQILDFNLFFLFINRNIAMK